MNLESVLEKRKVHYLKHVIFLILWIPIVILLFKMIEPKRVASIFASLGFLTLSFYIMFSEYYGPRNKIYLFVAGAFFIICALPVPLLRLIYWDTDYNLIVVGGIHASSLHELSNYMYITLLVLAVYCYGKVYFQIKNNKTI